MRIVAEVGWTRRQVGVRGGGRTAVPHHDRRAGEREAGDRGDVPEGFDGGAAPGGEAGNAYGGPDGAGLDLGRDVRYLMVTERGLEQHRVCGSPGIGVVGHVRGIAVGFGAIPEHLGDRTRDHAVQGVGVGRDRDDLVDVEVDAALQQGRVVHARHAEHGPSPFGRHRGDGATKDATLAVAVIEHVARVEQRGPVAGLECRVGSEPVARAQEAPQKQEVQEALLGPVGELGEVRDVRQRARSDADVLIGEAGPFRGAEHEVVLIRHAADIARVHLAVVPEESVSVDAGARGVDRKLTVITRRARDVADEAGGLVPVADGQAVGSIVES